MRSKNELDIICYLADCTLATVETLAMRRSRPKSEYRRQTAIAQDAVSVIRTYSQTDREYCYNYGNRLKEVIDDHDGSVSGWAMKMEPERRGGV